MMFLLQQTEAREFSRCNLDAPNSLRPCSRSAGLSFQSTSSDPDGPNTRLKARMLKAEASLEQRAAAKATHSALHSHTPRATAPKTVLSQPWRTSARTPATSSTPAKQRNSTRRVRFAFGPLSDTPDGHPFSGPQLMRRLDTPNVSYCSVLYKKEVLQLEELLGDEYRMSITKLKRRVNLLPMVYTPRPFVTVGLAGSGNSSSSGSVPGMDWV